MITSILINNLTIRNVRLAMKALTRVNASLDAAVSLYSDASIFSALREVMSQLLLGNKVHDCLTDVIRDSDIVYSYYL